MWGSGVVEWFGVVGCWVVRDGGVGSRYSIFDTSFGDPLESQRSMR